MNNPGMKSGDQDQVGILDPTGSNINNPGRNPGIRITSESRTRQGPTSITPEEIRESGSHRNPGTPEGFNYGCVKQRIENTEISIDISISKSLELLIIVDITCSALIN
jgi:hypothetical protein